MKVLLGLGLFMMTGPALALAPVQSAPPAQPAQPVAPASQMAIYTLAPADGWTNCSTATVVLSQDLTGSARKPIKATAGPGQTVCLKHAPFATTGYRKLGFLIHGGTTGGQHIAVMATANGAPIAGKSKELTLAANGWTKAEVPLANLGAEGQTIDGIVFQNTATTAAPAFYVTEIYLAP